MKITMMTETREYPPNQKSMLAVEMITSALPGQLVTFDATTKVYHDGTAYSEVIIDGPCKTCGETVTKHVYVTSDRVRRRTWYGRTRTLIEYGEAMFAEASRQADAIEPIHPKCPMNPEVTA